MKKIIGLFTVLAAISLMSALPAFSGTGPFGAFGPMDSFSARTVDDTHVSMIRGTGPYGNFGTEGYNIVPGAEKSIEYAWGTGPYGVLNANGLVARDKSNRAECLVVAIACPLRDIHR